MPGLITTWSVLLLVAAACEIQLVHSDQLEVGHNNIEIGNLRSELVAQAVAKLSNGEYQQGWWKLANAGWHDSAILRFFAEGPLGAADMQKLANVSGESAHTWVASQIANVTTHTNLMFALQQLSTVTYAMNKTIKGTGRIEASMWTLLFQCIGIPSCNEGYFTPLIFVPRSTKNQQQPDDHNYQYTYIRSPWLQLTSNLLVNAIPSYFAKLPRAMPLAMADVHDPQLSVMVNVYDNVSECPSTAAAVVDYRSLLDASYGLVPGLSCINFGTSEPFKLLVSRILFFDNATEPRDTSLTTLEELFSVLQVKNGQWKHLPFEACSEEGLLITSSQDPKSLKLCHQKICVTSYVGNATCSADGVQHLRFLHSITTLSKSCTYSGGKPLHPSNDTAPTEVTCQMSTENEVCNATVDVVDIEPAYNVNPLRLLSPKSNWTSTEGIDTSEFSQAPDMTDFNASRVCIRTPSPLSAFFFSDTTQAAFLQAIQIRARAYLNNFISEHNIAFMMTRGPASDSRSFLALIVSTAISVILAIAGPFPNFLLRIICRRWPLRLDSRCSRVNKVAHVSFEMICNVMLSFCSFLPVLYMAWSELDRERRFSTWDLASNDQFIYNSIGSEMQVRVVYLVSATSKYHSNFIIGSTLVVCITCITAGICSAWRSKEVFDRYAILQKYDSIQAGNGPFKELAADRETLLVSRAMKAIDMTEGEYLDMETKVMNHVRMQDLARLILPNRYSRFSNIFCLQCLGQPGGP